MNVGGADGANALSADRPHEVVRRALNIQPHQDSADGCRVCAALAILDTHVLVKRETVEHIEKMWREHLDEADRCDDDGSHVGIAMYHRNVARGIGEALLTLRAEPSG